MNIEAFLKSVVSQNETEMRKFFHKIATIKWHNTNEQFTLDEYIKVNCEYPDEWEGKIEKYEKIGNLIILVALISSKTKNISFYVTSFLKILDDKIIELDEYWGDNGNPPKWRINMNIGTKIS
jgi:hypothetical protein